MSFRKTLRLVGLVATLPLAACSTAPRRGVVVINCVSDSSTKSLHCVDASGNDLEVPWEKTDNYVCRPADEDKKFFEGMHSL